MQSFNKVYLIGIVGHDIEKNMTNSNVPVVNVSLAENQVNKNKEERTLWHNLVFWGESADLADRLLKKGSRIHVEGRINYRTWTNKENVKITNTEIPVDRFILLDKKEETDDLSY